MLRFTVKNTLLNRLKTRSHLSGVLFGRGHSTESINPQEKVDETENLENPYQPNREESERLAEFRKKLKEDIAAAEMNRYNYMTPNENDPLPPWPNNVNPYTGEIGGPRGPEPTRYGDWERKGICIDF